MFCQKCGRWIRKEFKFCPGCGVSPTNDSPQASSSRTSSQVQNLKEFKDLKTKERTQFVAKNPKGKKRLKVDRTATVIITIGITVFSKGTVKPIRGKSLPLRINKSATAETLREEALKKRRAYDKSFRNNRIYKLCYPDGSEVVNLPGTDERFTLEKYKEDLGSAYNRITFLLCPVQEESDNDQDGEDQNSKDEDNEDESMLPSKSKPVDWLQLSDDFDDSEKYDSDELLDDDELLTSIFGNSDGIEITDVKEGNQNSSNKSNPSAAENDSVQSTRVICEICHGTFPLGESCLICLQNDEYQQSLINDAQLQSQAATQASMGQPASEEQPVDIGQLRHHRLARLGLVGEESTVEQENSNSPGEDISDFQLDMPEAEIITIRRTQIRKDLIEYFKDPSILNRRVEFQIINERGLPEAGVGIGVIREVYSVFWNEFSNSLTIGERERVPFVRHDHFIEEWEAVGRIFVKGYTSVKYFPVFLSRAFICFCLFGTVTDDLCLSSFKRYLSQLEEDLIEEVLKSDDSLDQEFKDFLERFECRSLVKRESVVKILVEIAKQELIQKPHVMLAAWQPILRQGLKPFKEFQSVSAVLEFYAALIPTPKKVLDSLSSNPVNEPERNVFKYLQRYVRGLDSAQLVKFLRFTTASDVMGTNTLQVSFVQTEGFSSRPIAHTCGPLLQLPSTYNNFVEFREEFTNILKHDDLELDIV